MATQPGGPIDERWRSLTLRFAQWHSIKRSRPWDEGIVLRPRRLKKPLLLFQVPIKTSECAQPDNLTGRDQHLIKLDIPWLLKNMVMDYHGVWEDTRTLTGCGEAVVLQLRAVFSFVIFGTFTVIVWHQTETLRSVLTRAALTVVHIQLKTKHVFFNLLARSLVPFKMCWHNNVFYLLDTGHLRIQLDTNTGNRWCRLGIDHRWGRDDWHTHPRFSRSVHLQILEHTDTCSHLPDPERERERQLDSSNQFIIYCKLGLNGIEENAICNNLLSNAIFNLQFVIL